MIRKNKIRVKNICGFLAGCLLAGSFTLPGLGKTTTVVYAAEINKYANADFAMDTVVSETLYTSGEDLNTEIGEKLREMESGLLSWTSEDSQDCKAECCRWRNCGGF